MGHPFRCRFRFGIAEKKDVFQRYFSEKVKKVWKEEPERLWRTKELKPFTDYIELSNFALTESDLRVILLSVSYVCEQQVLMFFGWIDCIIILL